MSSAAGAAVSATSAASALTTPGTDSTTVCAPALPLLTRVKCGIIAFTLQNLVLAPAHHLSALHCRLTPPTPTHPTLTKSYPSQRSPPIRIFLPPNHPPGTPLPTLLTTHGGGFLLGRPSDNDAWNRSFSTTHSHLVIALSYPLAPSAPFPLPITALETLITSILADSSLPIDLSRVALLGWSAGANLALAVSQSDTLRPKLAAVVALYPIVDYVPPPELKLRTRRWKPALGGFRAKKADFLMSLKDVFNWAYVPAGTRCDDARLSPIYGKEFPRGVFVVGCELDMLANEAWRFACKVAGRKVPGVEEAVGCEGVVCGRGELMPGDDERFAWETRGRDGGWYGWLLVPDVVHGFDQEGMRAVVRDGECMADAEEKAERVRAVVARWLGEGPFRG